MSNIFSDNNFREQSEFDMSFSYLYRLNNIIYVNAHRIALLNLAESVKRSLNKPYLKGFKK